jgi:hypothetical protein
MLIDQAESEPDVLSEPTLAEVGQWKRSDFAEFKANRKMGMKDLLAKLPENPIVRWYASRQRGDGHRTCSKAMKEAIEWYVNMGVHYFLVVSAGDLSNFPSQKKDSARCAKTSRRP